MISGAVDGREARITIGVQGPKGVQYQISAVVDTGYTASLTLTSKQIAELELPWLGIGRGTLADGSECLFDVFEAIVQWDDNERRILIDEADTEPLLGMTLLNGHELWMEICPQGRVTVTPLQAAT